jgi:hypothetical protein
LTPSINAFSMSMVPQMRSSVAPSGSSTCSRRGCVGVLKVLGV